MKVGGAAELLSGLYCSLERHRVFPETVLCQSFESLYIYIHWVCQTIWPIQRRKDHSQICRF